MHTKRIIGLFLSVLLTLLTVSGVYASSAGDIEVTGLRVTDRKGTEITAICADTEEVTIDATVKMLTSGTVQMFAGIYGNNIEELKAVGNTEKVTASYGETVSFSLEFTAENLADGGVVPGDAIRIYFWDGSETMKPYTEAISSDEISKWYEPYMSNNIINYDRDTNLIDGDRWSYVSVGWCNGSLGPDIGNTDMPLVLMTKDPQNNGQNDNNWYQPGGMVNAWYLRPDGGFYTDSNRQVGWNYTIGPKTAGKQITITGKMSGAKDTEMFVFKTRDTQLNGDIKTALPLPRTAAEYMQKYDEGGFLLENCTSVKKQFKIVIPAEEALLGSDILFMPQVTGIQKTTIFDITVETGNTEQEPEHYVTDNIENYNANENFVGADRWSYVSACDVMGQDMELTAFRLLEKNADDEDVWFTDKNGKRWENWYMTADGTATSEYGRIVGWNYTVGEKTAGHDLLITGRATGDTRCDLFVMKTEDTAVSGEGTSAIGLPQNYMDSKYTVYPEAANQNKYGGNFQFLIPADEAAEGNDILFLPQFTSVGAPFGTSFNLTITALPKEENIQYDTPPVTAESVMGVNGSQQNVFDLGIKWERSDFWWDAVEPEQDCFSQNRLYDWGNEILDARSKGITKLPALLYTAPWAGKPQAFSYTAPNGDVFTGSEPWTDESGKVHQSYKGTDKKGNVFWDIPDALVDLSKVPFSDVEDWKDYVETTVSFLTAPPYNQEYFQIWNEAYPNSGFFFGDMDWYMENVHKPAAEIIHKYGAKVVYGAWPCGAPTDEFYSLLDEHDAWKTIDVFDCHYMWRDTMEDIYNNAAAHGVATPRVWQTEHGDGFAYMDYQFIPRMFNDMADLALSYRGDTYDDQFKMFHFAYWSPDDPNAFGYGNTMISGDHISDHGIAAQTFLKTMEGNLEKYTGYEMGVGLGGVYAFCADGKRVMMYIPASADNQTAGMTVTLNGIYGTKNVRIYDTCGRDEMSLTYTEPGSGQIQTVIPQEFAPANDHGYYLIAEADEVIAPTNSIKNFENGGKAADNTSFIAPGRWAYVNPGTQQPLSKATGQNGPDVGDWTIDDSVSSRIGCISSKGEIYTNPDTPTAFVYTVDEAHAGKDLEIAYTLRPGYSNTATLEIQQTTDQDKYALSGGYLPLQEKITAASGVNKPGTITIPAAQVQLGNDIVFSVTSQSGGLFVKKKAILDATISVKP